VEGRTGPDRRVAAVAEIRERRRADDGGADPEYPRTEVSELARLRGALRPAGAEFKI